ncbi:hypothetical protein [Clostridium estertheticum]|uniref:Uncharacterized protein n=1 Tax=Clostridium estertheticum TaxID=238834 RepID=A0A7Y3SWK0_9CLOT|nr:hypothetical protein [Clostridium estertheticum]NNU76345.1 hypothetical protein [Clostridium estertheticum]WBL45839.1 hypothetical protein LOR37_14235 [Clostridium estertheticum]
MKIESCIIEKITSESITDTYDKVLEIISFEIESTYDDLETYDDYCDITEYVLDNIGCDIYELIEDSIRTKLDEHTLDTISEDRFDIDSIIADEIDVNDIIGDEYDKVIYKQSDDFKESIEKYAKNIIALFEDASWMPLDK